MNIVITPVLTVLLLSSCSLFVPEPKEIEPIRAFNLTMLHEYTNRTVYGVAILPQVLLIGAHEGVYALGFERNILENDRITKESSRFKRIGNTTYANSKLRSVISRSDADGQWTILAESDVVFDAFQILPTGRIIIGVHGGIRHKDPESSDWVDVPIPIPGGLTPMTINTFLLASNGTLFAGTHDGVYRSLDMGQSWVKVSRSIHKDVDNFHYMYQELDGTILAIYSNKHHASADNGSTWTPRTIPSYGGPIYRDDGREYACIGHEIYFRNVGELDFRKTDLMEHLRDVIDTPNSITHMDVGRNRIVMHTLSRHVIVATPNPDWKGWEN